jgi:hypothetical protein
MPYAGVALLRLFLLTRNTATAEHFLQLDGIQESSRNDAMIVLRWLFRNDWDSPGPQAPRAPEMMRLLFCEGSGMNETRLETGS